jgi:hypothetical protein
MTNGCTSDVVVSGLTLRLGSAAWAVAGALPITTPIGQTRSFDVTFTAGVEPADDVLFVEISSPESGRRPLTLRGK